MKKISKVLLSFILLLSLSAVVQVETTNAATTNSKTKVFKNCKELNAVYPYGITNKAGTKNKVVSKIKDKTGKYISKTKYNPSKATVDANVYKLHAKMDNDKDGISCEK